MRYCNSFIFVGIISFIQGCAGWRWRNSPRPEEFFCLCGVPGHRNIGKQQRRETSERYTKCYSQQGLMMARPARRESDGAALTSESRNAEIMPRGVRLPLSPPLKLQDHESIYNKVQRLRGERYFQRFTLLLPQFVLRHPCHSGKRLRQDNNP